MTLIDIKNISYEPNLDEIRDYIDNPMFNDLCLYINHRYKAIYKIEYSKDVWARGWNVKFRKSGKSLCVIYPKNGYFTILVVVGKKEKERVEKLLLELSSEIQNIYYQTKEGMGQKWLMIDLINQDDVYQDILKLIQIRYDIRGVNT